MTTPSNEASKTARTRSLRFMNQTKNSTHYELPSLRAKPRQKQDTDSDDESDVKDVSDNGDINESEDDIISDSPSEDSDLEQDSDDGSVFSMDEVDDLDNEDELPNPTRSRDRQRRQQRQQHDTLMGNNTKYTSSRSNKRRLNDDGEDSMKLDDNRHLEQTTTSKTSPNNHHQPKKRKLRPSNTIRPTTIYNDLLSEDSEWMEQDLGIHYTSDMDVSMNDRRRKSAATSPLVLGSPSKIVKDVGDGERKQQQQQQQQHHGGFDITSVSFSPNQTGTSNVSPSSKPDEKTWHRRAQASTFLGKLQVKEKDTLDLSQHSFIPDDFFGPNRKTVAATAIDGHDSRWAGTKNNTTQMTNTDGDPDDMSDSDDMAYQYDFSTISEPNSMTINPASDPILDDQVATHTQTSSNPPTPTREDQPRPTPGFFRRIASFFFS